MYLAPMVLTYIMLRLIHSSEDSAVAHTQRDRKLSIFALMQSIWKLQTSVNEPRVTFFSISNKKAYLIVSQFSGKRAQNGEEILVLDIKNRDNLPTDTTSSTPERARDQYCKTFSCHSLNHGLILFSFCLFSHDIGYTNCALVSINKIFWSVLGL